MVEVMIVVAIPILVDDEPLVALLPDDTLVMKLLLGDLFVVHETQEVLQASLIPAKTLHGTVMEQAVPPVEQLVLRDGPTMVVYVSRPLILPLPSVVPYMLTYV